MLKEIVKDFGQGFFDSLKIWRLYQFLNITKYRRTMKRLLLTNMIFSLQYMLPVFPMSYLIMFFLNQFIILLHSLHYMDIVNSLSTKKTPNKINIMDIVTGNITLTLFLTMIYLSTEFIRYSITSKLYPLVYLMNLSIISIYHAFYCFNNHWHSLRISFSNRLQIHELKWPYFMGYGLLLSLIYHHLATPVYNIALACMISLPYRINFKYPTDQMSYPRINLSIFSNILVFIVKIIKSIPVNIKQ